MIAFDRLVSLNGIGAVLGLALACALGPWSSAWGQEAASYPARPVKVVVPFPPGGAPDTIGRTLGNRLAEELGQSFVIENRPGTGERLRVFALEPTPTTPEAASVQLARDLEKFARAAQLAGLNLFSSVGRSETAAN